MSNNYAELRRLRSRDRAAGERCAERLLAIRRRLAPLRARKGDGSLLLATWNIRDFGSTRFNFGERLPETFFYLAEIVSSFDLVAIQEVNRNLGHFGRLMELLGREWDYIATDTTEGFGGNGERMAFVYNTEKVWFRKIAGEVVLPDGQLIVSRKKTEAEEPTARADAAVAEAEAAVEAAVEGGIEEVKQQFARTPFVVAFQSGWFKFNLCTVHIYFGEDSGLKLERRINEIAGLVDFFAKRQDAENKGLKDDPARAENYILLGDFNVVSPEHKTMQALKRKGFEIPAEIDGDKVRTPDDHFYDQIAVRVVDPRFSVVTGGLVDIYADVFRDTPEDRAIWADKVPGEDREADPRFRATTPQARYLKWRTWQMSDHKPLWLQIETDFADHYLGTLKPQPDGG